MARQVKRPLNIDESIRYGVFVEPANGQVPDFFEDFEWIPAMTAANQPFRPYRLVIDLELDPSFANSKVRVYFTHDDRKQIKHIKLIKWDEVNDIWVLISPDPIHLSNNQVWAGYFQVTGAQVGDPTIALGE